MKQYIIYKADTGEVLSAPAFSEGQVAEIPPQIAGAAMLEMGVLDSDLDLKGYVDIHTHQFIEFNPEQRQGKLDAYKYNSTWSYADKAWVPEQDAVLERKKEECVAKIQSQLSEALNAPVEIYEEFVNGGSSSLLNLTTKLYELEIETQGVDPSTLFWRMLDNTHKQFTSPEEMIFWLKEVLAIFSRTRSAAYQTRWDKKAVIDGATSVEELEALGVLTVQ